MLNLPKTGGLWPHFLRNGELCPGTEWSSVDTTIALIASMIACQALGIDDSGLRQIAEEINWVNLTDSNTRSISHGYSQSGHKLTSTWDVFGSEAFLVGLLYAVATQNRPIWETYPLVPTWNGSGFNDELAALFFPMAGVDLYGNDWSSYRAAARGDQFTYPLGDVYAEKGLFGLSAGEVPEPWAVAEDQVYQAFGIGGHNQTPNDGRNLIGFPAIQPHYAAMISPEQPDKAATLFQYLIEEGVFSPLNNVESLGLDGDGLIHWNSLKGSWNLGLQVLGLGRALSGGEYLPYRIVADHDFLKTGYRMLMNE